MNMEPEIEKDMAARLMAALQQDEFVRPKHRSPR